MKERIPTMLAVLVLALSITWAGYSISSEIRQAREDMDRLGVTAALIEYERVSVQRRTNDR